MRYYPRVDLTQPLENVLRAGHPWIFEDALRHPELEAGDAVDVYDMHGAWLGRGIIDPDSPIRVRLWTRNPQTELDNRLLDQRIRQAMKRRPFPTADTNGFRLLNGEGDRVPGLVCDIYGDVAVLRPDGLAAERWLKPARQTISKLLPVKHWAIKRSNLHRGKLPRAEWWECEAPAETTFVEGGLTYVVDPMEGQKTGFFLDQRANRRRLAELCVGRRLLNLFGYTGAFSLAAAARGAARTTTVDLAAPAIADARRNFERNHIPAPAHGFEACDAFEYLEQFDAERAPFEVAVCDPPSFAHRHSDVPRATEAYTRIFQKLIEVMPTGATIALASCSSHIDRGRFLNIVSAASQRAGAELVLTGTFGADVDHPTLAAFPEGDYLQFSVGTLCRD
ncbi:class I SAM-dependent rRNA methyltransferase [Lujinxingia sediminis]|nr:class I SAM-dependent rRNA methyltransferase [Lujinxingia sediminis]